MGPEPVSRLESYDVQVKKRPAKPFFPAGKGYLAHFAWLAMGCPNQAFRRQ